MSAIANLLASTASICGGLRSKPAFAVLPGPCDCHAPVFGPLQRWGV